MGIEGTALPVLTAGVFTGVILECAGMPWFAWTAAGAVTFIAGWLRARSLVLSPRVRRTWWTAMLLFAGAISGTLAVARIDAMCGDTVALHAGQSIKITADVIRVTLRPEGARLTLGRIHVAGAGHRRGLAEIDAPAGMMPAEGDRVELGVELWPAPRKINPLDPDWSVPMLGRGVHASGRASGAMRIVGEAERGPLLRAGHWLRSVQAHAVSVLPDEEAGVLSGLMLGDSSRLPPETGDAFAAAGVTHLLAASGLHLGVVYSIIDSALRGSRLPKWAAGGLMLASSLVYASAVGLKASIVRAFLVACLANLGILAGRAPSPLHLVCFGASAQVLAQPVLVWDMGFRLSYSAFSTVVAVPRMLARTKVRGLWSAFITSAAISLVTWPITVGIDGKVSLIGPIVNIVAIPLATAALVGGLVGALAGAVMPWAGEALVRGAGVLVSLLVAFVRSAAGLPFSEVRVAPLSPVELVIYYAGLAIAAYAASSPVRGARFTRVVKRHRWRCAAVVAAAVVVFAQPGPFRITVLSVGQADAALIRSPGGACILVDTGTARAGSGQLVPFLGRQGIRRIDLVVITHEHADHAGGLAAVAESADIGVLAVGKGMPQAEVDRLVTAATSIRGEPTVIVVRRGQTLRVRDIHMEVMNPDDSHTSDANARSVVLRLHYRGITCLMCADAGRSYEAWAVDGTQPTDVHLLKVGHHGSATSSGAQFLRHMSPLWAAISVGRNSYGHPSAATISGLAAAGATVLRTDVHGAIELTAAWLSGRPRVKSYADERTKVPLFRKLRTNAKSN